MSSRSDMVLNFEELFNSSPNPYMILDRNFRFAGMNEAYLKTTDRKREDVLGRHVFDAFPGDPEDPDDSSTAQLLESLNRVLTEKKADTLAMLRYSIPKEGPDGWGFEERFWSVSHTPIFDADGEVAFIMQHALDITEMLKLKKALHDAEHSEEATVPPDREGLLFHRARAVQETNRLLDAERRQLRQLFEQAPGFMAVVLGPDHVYNIHNTSYYRMIGEREILGKPVREALPELAGQGYLELLDYVFTSGDPFVGEGMEVRIRQKPDAPLSVLYLDFIYQPIFDGEGNVFGIFVQGHDVTSQKETQDELQRLNNTLEQRVTERTAELEQRNRELQEFASMASHDLQEPLRKVIAFTDLLEEEYAEKIDERGAFYFDRVKGATRRMHRLIQDLLAYTQVTTSEQHVSTSSRIRMIADEVVRDLNLRIEESRGEVDLSELPDITIQADPIHMRLLLQNLIGNALKFSRPGIPPVVKIRGGIEERGTGEGTFVLEVEDNGIGFEEEYAEKILAPFVRLHSIDEYPGTGVGLAICRRIAERHHGTLRPSGRPGHGSTFTLTIPQKTAITPIPT